MRKTVTVLVCDVTGSTTLGEMLDPESLRGVMSRYFDEVRATVERHGAQVEKFIGDAVHAVFGMPLVHEDDALRAVRAAVDISEKLRELNEELAQTWGVRIQVRMGINTGEVIVGHTKERETLLFGDAINVASRLERLAEPGEIMLGKQTYALVRDAVRVEEVQPVVLRGKTEAVGVYKLLEVIVGAPAHSRRVDSPLIGRDEELALIKQAFDRCVRESSCHLFTLLGPAGVGKSRLVAEFLRAIDIDDEAPFLQGRCLPYGEGITFWPVVEVIRQAAEVADEDSEAQILTKMEALLEGEEDAPLVVDRLAQLIGLSEASAPAEEIFWSIRRLFESCANTRALLVVFDDIHWAEPTLLDLIEYIADWARHRPIFLLCMARPDLLDERPTWGGGKPNATSICLEPLRSEQSEELIEHLLGTARLSEEVQRRIAARAEGNPLFVEELVGMLIDDGLLVRSDDGWTTTSDLSNLSIPPTIQALLAARLDRLGAEERQVIERAAVVGQAFHRAALEDLLPEDLRARLEVSLFALVRKELIRPHRSRGGEEEFRFHHILVRDAAYAELPKTARAELHERLANWIEAGARPRVYEGDEILGYHLEQACRYRSEIGPEDEHNRRLAMRASERLASAGRRALVRDDRSAAVNLLRRAVALLPRETSARNELLPDLGMALVQAGQFGETHALLAEADEVLGRGEGSRLAGHTTLVRLWLQLFTSPDGWTDYATEELQRLLHVFESMADEVGVSRTRLLLFSTQMMRAQAGPAEGVLNDAVAHAGRLSAGDEAGFLSLLALPCWVGPRPVADSLQRCQEIRARGNGEPKVESAVSHVEAVLHAMLGNFDLARSLIAENQGRWPDLGFYLGIAHSSRFVYKVEMLAGDAEAAEEGIRHGYRSLEQIGEKTHLSTVAAMLAEALIAQERYAEGHEFTVVSERAAARDDLRSQWLWRATRAKVFIHEGHVDEAERLAREAVHLVEQSDFLDEQGSLYLNLAEVLQAAGRADEARTAARVALGRFDTKGNRVSAARARATLEQVQLGARG